MKGFMYGLVAALVLAGSGCIPDSSRELIRDEVKAHDADLAEWETLSEAEHREAYQSSRDSFHILNYSINGADLPEDLR